MRTIIKHVDENIFNASENIICHQTNCFGEWDFQSHLGTVLALQIRKAYPDMYKSYCEHCASYNSISAKKNLLLGKVLLYYCGKNPKGQDTDRYIANIFGQLFYGRDKCHTDYEALKKAFTTLGDYAHKNSLSIAIPQNMGCNENLCGGDWVTVYTIIEETIGDLDVTIYNYN